MDERMHESQSRTVAYLSVGSLFFTQGLLSLIFLSFEKEKKGLVWSNFSAVLVHQFVYRKLHILDMRAYYCSVLAGCAARCAVRGCA